jgi:hypothetical protein
MQNDEYAARTAMLNISRELHRGWRQVTFTPLQFATDPVTGDIEVSTPARLNLSGLDGAEVEYKFERGYYDAADKMERSIISGDTPVAFEAVSINDFLITVDGLTIEPDGSFTFDGEEEFPAVPRLEITLVCENGLKVSTKVALLRIPATSGTGP